MNQVRRFAVGDIHGGYDKLRNVLDQVKFSDSDELYGVGDYCDRGMQNIETLRFLMSLSNFHGVVGNHDIWPYQDLEADLGGWRLARDISYVWDLNGGGVTKRELLKLSYEEKSAIKEWYGNLKFQIELDDVIIKHTASINTQSEPYTDITLQVLLGENYCNRDYDSFVWDRALDKELFGGHSIKGKSYYKEFFKSSKWTIYGHTPHINHGPYYDKEFRLVNIDCGAFATADSFAIPKDGQLALLNLDTFEWVKSDGTTGKIKKSKS